MGRFTHSDYVEMTMHFRCNLKCVHCMIEGTMDRLEPESAGRFQEVLQENARTRQWRGMTFTGAEITLRQDLPELARRAREHGFEHVRIQTHGMGLSDEGYCRELIDAGVDEFFVSVTASTAERHDSITGLSGSFESTINGLEMLEQFENVVSLTNTVVTARSFQDLPRVVDRLRHLRRLVQMDFWTYWPMSESDEKTLIVSHLEVLPFLKEAIQKARALGRAVELKNFPECLLGNDREILDNSQPKLIIDPAFWPEFMRNGFHQCVYRDVCGAEQCLGLNSAYVEKFGWHADILQPFPRSEAVQPPHSRSR